MAAIIRNCLPPIFLVLFGLLSHAQEKQQLDLREGDIVFSSSTRGQGAAIIAATSSPYTHCGIVVNQNGVLMVLEAVQPVRLTSLDQFSARSRPGTFTARRPTKQISKESYKKAREWLSKQVGGDYDLRFEWTDQKLYCSELVWKAYQQAGVELCELRRLRDYDLEHPIVKKLIKERFGGPDHLPRNEKIVAPSDLIASTLLVEVPVISK